MENISLYIAISIAIWIATKHYLSKNQNLPPSPFPALPIIGHLHLFREPLHRSLHQVSRRHGPLLFLRLGVRQILLVSSPAAIEECFHKHDAVFANRPPFFIGQLFGYNFTTLLWAPYGDIWRNLRRISSTEILSFHRLQLYAGIRAEEVKSLIQRVYHHAPPEEGSDYRKVDMKSAFMEMTTNVMTRMLAGRRYYGEGKESEEGKRFKTLMTKLTEAGGITSIGDFFPWLRTIGIRGVDNKFKALFHDTDAFMQDLLEEWRTSGEREADGEKMTVTEVLLSLQKSDPGLYTEEMIKGFVLVMLQAGTETSSSTMEWAISLLLNNPEAMNKARAEIDSHVGFSRLVEESDLKNLPYLHSVILETLRIRPVVPLVFHHSSAECTVGGYTVPAGTILVPNAWAVHHDPEVWDEPEKFKPERFEGEEGNRVGFKLMAFGFGRRACPGEGLAMRVVAVALGGLIQCFEWERVGEEVVDLQESAGLTAPKMTPLVAKLRPRKEMGSLIRF